MISANGRAFLHIPLLRLLLEKSNRGSDFNGNSHMAASCHAPQPAQDPNPMSLIYHDLQMVIDYLIHKM